MRFFGSGEKPAEVGQGAGRSEDAVYRGEVSPIDGADLSQPIEFSLSEDETIAAQKGRLEARGMIGDASIAPEDVTTARAHLFGENLMPQGGTDLPSFASFGTPKSPESAGDGGNAPVAPGSQGNGENHISYSPPETKSDGEENSEKEAEMPSVLGGF